MDFPTVKKPKANKQLSATTGTETAYKPGIFETISKMEGESGALSAKDVSNDGRDFRGIKNGVKDKGPGITAKMGGDDSDIADSASKLADKVKASTGNDKSNKAEILRIRALLVKGKAGKIKEKSMQAEEDESGRYKRK